MIYLQFKKEELKYLFTGVYRKKNSIKTKWASTILAKLPPNSSSPGSESELLPGVSCGTAPAKGSAAPVSLAPAPRAGELHGHARRWGRTVPPHARPLDVAFRNPDCAVLNV